MYILHRSACFFEIEEFIKSHFESRVLNKLVLGIGIGQRAGKCVANVLLFITGLERLCEIESVIDHLSLIVIIIIIIIICVFLASRLSLKGLLDRFHASPVFRMGL